MTGELIRKFRSCLEQFEYPNINFLNDEQVADLFNPENRKFIVTWLMRNLSNSVVIPTDWKSAECLIADFLHESGFCEPSQKHLFVLGDVTLPIKDQILIFERIFGYLEIIKKENVGALNSTNYNIESLINTNINIFPTLGPPKLLSQQEKQQKLSDYKQSCANLEKFVEEFKSNNDVVASHCITQIPLDTYETDKVDIGSFHSKAIKLQEAASTLNKVNANQTQSELNGFNPEFEEYLETCAAQTEEVMQYLKNLNITFSNDNEEVESFYTDLQSEMYDVVMQHARIASDTVEAIKNNKKLTP